MRRRLTGTSTRRLTRRGRVIGPKSRSRRLDWYIDTQRLLSEAEAEAEGLRARVAELEARGQARCSRDAAEMQARCSRDTGEMQPRCRRDAAEVRGAGEICSRPAPPFQHTSTPPLRHFRDASETLPRRFRDTSETLPRHSLGRGAGGSDADRGSQAKGGLAEAQGRPPGLSAWPGQEWAISPVGVSYRRAPVGSPARQARSRFRGWASCWLRWGRRPKRWRRGRGCRRRSARDRARSCEVARGRGEIARACFRRRESRRSRRSGARPPRRRSAVCARCGSSTTK